MAGLVFLLIGLCLFYNTIKLTERYWQPVVAGIHLLFFVAIVQRQLITATFVLVIYFLTSRRIADFYEVGEGKVLREKKEPDDEKED